MFKKNDPYRLTKFLPLGKLDSNQNFVIVGNLFLEYEVMLYDSVQLNDPIDSKATIRQYLVHCTQKINVWNPSAANVSPSKNLNSYDDYPAMINTDIVVGGLGAASACQLMSYSPQTINTKVQTSQSASDNKGKTQTATQSSTVGSTTSETNSYGFSVNSGIGPEGGSFGASENYEHSSTVTHEQSSTTGSEQARTVSHDISGSASMSIKDWGAYAMVNADTKSPTWTFGQEYPWDVIQCRKTDTDPPLPDGRVHLVLPEGMLARLYDGDTSTLYPPSQLSMFGINFVMKAVWLLTLDDKAADNIELDHTLNYFSASHKLTGQPPPGAVEVYLDKQPAILLADKSSSGSTITAKTSLNVPLMALEPLGTRGRDAIVGFIPNKFTILPAPSQNSTAAKFKIFATTNDLMIFDTTNYTNAGDGAGFAASETRLTASFSQGCALLTMRLYFKVIDTVTDYTLFMKHWKTGDIGVAVKFVVNGDTANSITKYVDAMEAEGGEKNLLSLALRNLDYASVDYHDYLQLGVNWIDIAITPIGGAFVPNCGYQIRAVSIEKA